MNDLEICNRIAAIEESEDCSPIGKRDKRYELNKLYGSSGDHMMFKLIIKYKVVLYPELDGTYLSKIVGCKIGSKDKSPYRSICLAIIEHYEGVS